MCEKCVIGQDAYKNALAEFDAKYPKACKRCGGSGIVYWMDDPSAFGVSLAAGRIEYEETCLGCEAADKPVCAVCGKPLDAEFMRACGCSIGVHRPIAETFFDIDCEKPWPLKG